MSGARERVYEAVAGAKDGLTDNEVAEALGLPKPSVRRSRRELQLAGRLGTSGERLVAGRKALVFVALDESPAPRKVGCPLCSAKGWIVRAPTPEPIPLLPDEPVLCALHAPAEPQPQPEPEPEPPAPPEPVLAVYDEDIIAVAEEHIAAELPPTPPGATPVAAAAPPPDPIELESPRRPSARASQPQSVASAPPAPPEADKAAPKEPGPPRGGQYLMGVSQRY